MADGDERKDKWMGLVELEDGKLLFSPLSKAVKTKVRRGRIATPIVSKLSPSHSILASLPQRLTSFSEPTRGVFTALRPRDSDMSAFSLIW